MVKGALNTILKCSFLAEFHLSYYNWCLLIYKHKKRNSKNPSESEEIINLQSLNLIGGSILSKTRSYQKNRISPQT